MDQLNRKGIRGRPSLQLMEERHSEIVSMLLDCKTRKYIYDNLHEKYNIGQKACDALVTKAYQIIKENYSPDRESIINQHIQKYYSIVEFCEHLDPKSQIAAMQSIEKLLKLHSPETLIQQNSLNISLKDLSIKDLKALLKE